MIIKLIVSFVLLAAGKVNTIIVPQDFKGFISVPSGKYVIALSKLV